MSDLQATFTFVVFGSVLLVIVFDLLDMALAALLGVSALSAVGVFSLQDILNVVRVFGGPLALLFGGMVVARTLMPTGLLITSVMYFCGQPEVAVNVFFWA